MDSELRQKLYFASVLFHPQNLDFYFEDFKLHNADLLLVVNGRDDSTMQLISENFPSAVKILNDDNIGFGQAANQAIKKAIEIGADFICLFNQDVRITKNDIAGMLGHFLNDSELIIASPLNIDKNGNIEHYFYRNLIEQGGKLEYQGLQYLNFINAACWLMDLRKVQVCGGFNDIFFMYGEDLNFADRARFLAYKIAVDMEVKVLHDKQERFYQKELFLSVNVHTSYLMAKFLNPNRENSFLGIILTHFRYSCSSLIKGDLRQMIVELMGLNRFMKVRKLLLNKKKEQTNKGAFLT